MTVRHVEKIFCDDKQEGVCDRYYVSSFRDIERARSEASGAGWTSQIGLDWCPRHGPPISRDLEPSLDEALDSLYVDIGHAAKRASSEVSVRWALEWLYESGHLLLTADAEADRCETVGPFGNQCDQLRGHAGHHIASADATSGDAR